jgi:hypothetical protein
MKKKRHRYSPAEIDACLQRLAAGDKPEVIALETGCSTVQLLVWARAQGWRCRRVWEKVR